MAVFQDKDKKKDITGVQLGPTNVSGGSSAPASPAAPTAQQKQGSGRFTNLQQYLNANKTGGQKLAGGIGENIKKEIEPAKKETSDYNSKVSEGIQGAQGALNQGGQNLQQLKTIDTNIQGNTGADKYQTQSNLGINEFKNDPNYGQFKNIQGGNAINENALNLNQQMFSNNANQYFNTANTALNNLGTEGGRFELLKKSFGGTANPNYNRGQQRLDQLFLKQQGVGDLKNQVSEEARAANQFVKSAAQTGRDVGNVVSAEQQLINDINTQAGTNENNYIKMLESYIPKVNELRGAEYQSLEDAIKNKGKTLDATQIGRLGINAPTRAYDVFNTLQGASDVAIKGNDAATYGDVAKQSNVDEYSALADILGMQNEEKKLTEASKLGDAYTGRTDDGSLMNRIAGRKKNFDTVYGGKKAFSGTSDAAMAAGNGQTLNEFLQGKGTNPGTFVNMDQAYYDNFAKQLDTEYMDKINKSGYGNVITPDALVDTSAGLNKQIGKGTYSDGSFNGADNSGSTERYGSKIDDSLRNAWQSIYDKYNKVGTF